MKENLIHELSNLGLAELLSAGRGIALVELWAPWCGPCRALRPALDSIARSQRDLLTIYTVNVDTYPDALSVARARSIPTTVLYRDGLEIDRILGARTSTQLYDWLQKRVVPLAGTTTRLPDRTRFEAFYGDNELREFLISRLRSAAINGSIVNAFMPYWQDGRGSISASLVHSSDPVIFERISGLPCSFACAIEFAGLKDPEDIDAIMGKCMLEWTYRR
ncbi:MAG: thioredoxin domain-containing protein [Burkholderia sp.]